MSDISTDRYAAAAGDYDLFNLAARGGQVAALAAFARSIRTTNGPVLDVGAGSGLNAAWLLEHLPAAQVLALEPSPAMRSLASSRIAAHPEWFDRVTVRPEDFFSASLPERIGGAVLLGVLGHFDAMERAAVFAELASRLPAGGVALLDLQQPERPTRIEAHEFTAAVVGELTYRGIAEAWPLDIERMRWKMTYLTLEGDRVLTEATAELDYHHPTAQTVRTEAAGAGLDLERLGGSTHWILTRQS
jgi:SAM-dependent methyltransferase